MVAFEKFLKQFPNYRPGIIEEVYPFLTIEQINAGEYFLRQGSICQKMAFIEKGLARLYYLNDGKEITNCFCKENTITTSYSSLISRKPSEMTIQAIEDTTLITLSYDLLQRLYESVPFWQQVGRMAAENEILHMECHHRFLRDLTATERYQRILNEDGELLQRVPLQYLASYLQVAPETLSRIRKKMGRT